MGAITKPEPTRFREEYTGWDWILGRVVDGVDFLWENRSVGASRLSPMDMVVISYVQAANH